MTLLAVLGAAAVAVAGCGTDAAEQRPDRDATLLLDAAPNGVHAGIYSAVVRGYDEAEGVRLHVRAPTAHVDAVRALRTGRAQFALVDLRELARTRDAVAVMAVVRGPPDLVLAATQQTVDDEPALVGATVRALIRGYRFTLSDPESSVQDLVRAARGVDPGAARRRLDSLAPAFLGPSGRVGVLDEPRLRRRAAPRFADRAPQGEGSG